MKRPKPFEPTDPVERLYWSTELWAARRGHCLPSFSVELTMADIDKGLFGPALPPAYPPRVRNWIINWLDNTPRVTAEHPRALCVTLHKPGTPSLVFGYFDIYTSEGKSLLFGLYAYHKRLRRKLAQEQKRQQRELGRMWILGELGHVSLGDYPRCEQRRQRRSGAAHSEQAVAAFDLSAAA